MKIPFLDLRAQYLELKQEFDDAVMRVLDSGWYILGKECEEFEAGLAEFLTGEKGGGVVAVNSGTDALKLSLLAAGVNPGDEVITVANTAIPTAAAICSIGAVPVFCDVDPQTWLIDPAKVESCITKRTKALIPVHLYGAVCDMDSLTTVAEAHGIQIVEDVAQAAGSVSCGRHCGTIGRFGAFSFYPSKNLGAFGDGGAVYTKKQEDREMLFRLRNYGQSTRYLADVNRGENSRLDELQAAILTVKLKHLKRWNTRRQALAVYFKNSLISNNVQVELQRCKDGTNEVHHLFVTKVPAALRDRVQLSLQENGVQTLVHYPVPLYRQPAFRAYARGANPVAEELCDSVLSLPFHQYLTEVQIDFISERLAASLASAGVGQR